MECLTLEANFTLLLLGIVLKRIKDKNAILKMTECNLIRPDVSIFTLRFIKFWLVTKDLIQRGGFF